jgi:hypothetical protein
MPYIITIHKRFDFQDSGVGGVQVESRRAVATLEEARTATCGIVVDSAFKRGSTEGYPPSERIADPITESGGSVGPLPDGTVIEVEHIATVWNLAEIMGEPAPLQQRIDDPRAAWRCMECSHYSHPDRDECTQCALVAAYNAKQATNAV